jgi:hypothetical protein
MEILLAIVCIGCAELAGAQWEVRGWRGLIRRLPLLIIAFNVFFYAYNR